MYNAIHIYDIICLAETYISYDILFEDNSLSILGYELIKVNHPSNQKQGDILTCHENFLRIKVNNVIWNNVISISIWV